jgi:hypothetical protein
MMSSPVLKAVAMADSLSFFGALSMEGWGWISLNYFDSSDKSLIRTVFLLI